MAVAAVARGAGRDAGGGRAGDAVPQPPRLCAADPVRSLRPQDELPALLGLAGGASLSQAAGLPSLRLSRSPTPHECPECGRKARLIACGPGVERVAEEFAQLFPEARVPIASSDTLHGPAQTQAAIRAMAKHEIDVLIGTQIVAKGHHFPQLTLVGVIDADLGGADGDLRARERTFQLLHQVAGRAGRGEKPGLVLIQTRNPDDPVMQALASGDRDAFYEQERSFRERAAAPPFGRLAALILSGQRRRCGARSRRDSWPKRRRPRAASRCGGRRRRSITCCAARRASGCWCRPNRRGYAGLSASLARVR